MDCSVTLSLLIAPQRVLPIKELFIKCWVLTIGSLVLRTQRCTELSFCGGGGGRGKEVYKGLSDSLEILSVGDLPLL